LIELFDMTGKQVSTTRIAANNAVIDLSKLAKGLYLIRITNQEAIIHQSKIIKQ
jgi:hypothetical protein